MKELQEKRHYNTKDNGGWSVNIKGNTAKLSRNNNYNVLPNCCGWSSARFNEFGNRNDNKWLGNRNANKLYDLGKSQGLQVGKEPRLGAAIVWDNGDCGHIANVERVNKDGSIYVSESGWNAKSYYWHSTLRGSNFTTGESWLSSYKLLGFVYQPLLKQMYVNAKAGLNLRTEPNTNCTILSTTPYKTKVNIYAIQDGWGATEKGWVCLDYLQDNEIVEEVKIEEPKEPLPMEEEIIKEIEKIAEEKKEDIPAYYEEKEKNNSLLWLIQKFIEFIKKLFSK